MQNNNKTTNNKKMITKYDALIKKTAQNYLPNIDWRLLKAQLAAESNLNPQAKSQMGAMGIAQIMPKTWEDIIKETNLPTDANAYNPDHAIPACAYYMKQLSSKWSSEREEADRYCLALASYNAGFGNLLKAQKLAGGAAEYHAIIAKLPEVTGKNAQETQNYAPKIFSIFNYYLFKGR